jgi:hypothetical protein
MNIKEQIKRFTVSNAEAVQAFEKLTQRYNLQNRIIDRFIYVMTKDYSEICEELYDRGELSQDQQSRVECSLLKIKRQIVRFCIEGAETKKLSAKINRLTEAFKRLKATMSPKMRRRVENNIFNLHTDLKRKFEQLQLEAMDLAAIESEHQILLERLEPNHPTFIWYNSKSKRYEFTRVSKKYKKK